jgi:hypothetical protein
MQTLTPVPARAASAACFHFYGLTVAVSSRCGDLRRNRHCVVYGTDLDLVHEIAYHFILSTAGQHLNSRGLHRVHALGVAYRERGILFLAPSGGGKSTMALELLRRPGFTLLGEDTPWWTVTAISTPFRCGSACVPVRMRGSLRLSAHRAADGVRPQDTHRRRLFR